jgi:hypothetical protein
LEFAFHFEGAPEKARLAIDLFAIAVGILKVFVEARSFEFAFLFGVLAAIRAYDPVESTFDHMVMNSTVLRSHDRHPFLFDLVCHWRALSVS